MAAIAVALTLTSCAGGKAAPEGHSTSAVGPAAPSDTAAAADPFPENDLSSSNTCGQVSAYVSVISNALIEHASGVLDDSGYVARLQGVSEPLSYLTSDDTSVNDALTPLTRLAGTGSLIDPTSDTYDLARQGVSDACAAAGSPIVIVASDAAGG